MDPDKENPVDYPPSPKDLIPALRVFRALSLGPRRVPLDPPPGWEPQEMGMEVHPLPKGGWRVSMPQLRPYGVALGLRDGRILFAEIRHPERGASIYVSQRGIRFNGKVPVGMLWEVQRNHLRLLLPYFGGRTPPNLFLEAQSKGARLDWGGGTFHQRGAKGRERWVVLDPVHLRVVLYEPREPPAFGSLPFSSYEEFLGFLPSLLLFPWDLAAPREAPIPPPLLPLLPGEVWPEELHALRAFSDALLAAYTCLVGSFPWARALLPPFLPDGRATPRFPKDLAPRGEAPEGDPFLAMATFWDGLALDLSWGRVDLLPFTPSPIRVWEGWLLYGPSWATLLPVKEADGDG